MTTSLRELCALCPTAEAGECPVAANVRGLVGQLEGERPRVRVQVTIHCCNVDAIGVWTLTHLCLLRKHPRGVIVDVQQIDLQSARPAGWRNTCKVRGREIECVRGGD